MGTGLVRGKYPGGWPPGLQGAGVAAGGPVGGSCESLGAGTKWFDGYLKYFEDGTLRTW